jgi:hypothetical protein
MYSNRVSRHRPNYTPHPREQRPSVVSYGESPCFRLVFVGDRRRRIVSVCVIHELTTRDDRSVSFFGRCPTLPPRLLRPHQRQSLGESARIDVRLLDTNDVVLSIRRRCSGRRGSPPSVSSWSLTKARRGPRMGCRVRDSTPGVLDENANSI